MRDQAARPARSQCRQDNPCEIVQRLAEIIQHVLTAWAKLRRGPTVVATLALFALVQSAHADDGRVPNAAAGSEQDVLVGVGVVIGLPGTGDSAIDANAIEASIVGVLERAGLEPWRDQIKPGRVAVVMLSAQWPDGAHDGTRIAVSVSALGDARSIAGGTLLVAPLRGADGTVRAIGQGPIIADGAATTAAVPDSSRRTGKLAQSVVVEHQAAAGRYAALTP